jgi:ABC-type polysaccharide/polyol phosphate transport system ATPase subunit
MKRAEEMPIRVRELSKVYRLYSHMLIEAVSRKPRYREHWALRNVSFEVGRGQVLGIVGRNGVGKMTLLRIIAGTGLIDFVSNVISARTLPSSVFGTVSGDAK